VLRDGGVGRSESRRSTLEAGQSAPQVLTLGDLARELGLVDLTQEPRLMTHPVAGAHASDLLSDVLAHAPRGGITITLQAHASAVAVAVHARQCALVITGGARPAPDVVARARAEGVALLATDLDTFEVAGRLFALGLRGRSSRREESRFSA
jgi:hypothetical protein